MKDVYIGQAFELTRKAPTEVQIFPRGKWTVPGQKKRFDFNDKFFDQLIANFKSAGNEIVVDYEHAAELSGPGQKAVAAGWISGFTKKADGLWARVKEWTEDARRHIEAREYKYISPAWASKSMDPRTSEMAGAELLSVALVNKPHFVGMEPLFASTKFHLVEKEKEKEDGMDPKLLAKALGLPEDSDEETILAAASDLKEKASKKEEPSKAVASKEVLEMLGLEEGATADDVKVALASHGKKAEKKEGEKEGDSAILAGIKAIGERLDGVEKAHKDSTVALAKKECEELIDGAIKAGKVFPYEREELVALAGAQPADVTRLIEKRPVIVPINQRIAGGKAPDGKEGAVVITASQAAINSQLGVSEEEYKKHFAAKNKEDGK